MKEGIAMSLWTTREKVAVMARLADLAETQYRLLLGLDALLDILADRGLVTRQEFEERCRQLDRVG